MSIRNTNKLNGTLNKIKPDSLPSYVPPRLVCLVPQDLDESCLTSRGESPPQEDMLRAQPTKHALGPSRRWKSGTEANGARKAMAPAREYLVIVRGAERM